MHSRGLWLRSSLLMLGALARSTDLSKVLMLQRDILRVVSSVRTKPSRAGEVRKKFARMGEPDTSKTCTDGRASRDRTMVLPLIFRLETRRFSRLLFGWLKSWRSLRLWTYKFAVMKEPRRWVRVQNWIIFFFNEGRNVKGLSDFLPNNTINFFKYNENMKDRTIPTCMSRAPKYVRKPSP